MFDFPASPTVGQTYPSAPLPGQPVYKWTGVVWNTRGVASAPLSTKTLWTDGSKAMTAELTLAGDPVSSVGAADKHYSDNSITGMGPPAGSVRYDTAQGLSPPQQQQSRDNMGVVNSFPPGATMLFYQASAPVGWTQSLAHNDKALRVVGGGTGGSAGGTNPFSSVMAQSAVGNHTLSLSEMSTGITNTGTGGNNLYIANNQSCYLPISTAGWAIGPMVVQSGSGYTPNQNSGGGISWTYANYTVGKTSNNTQGHAHNHAVTMDINYCDVIIATKD